MTENNTEAFKAYQTGAPVTNMIVDEMTFNEGQFIIALTTTVDGEENRDQVFDRFSRTALDVAHQSNGSSVSWNHYDDYHTEEEDREDLYYDEYTLVKVIKAINENGFTEKTALELVTAMQNAGILFRERPKSQE
jgi:hypothetical protein